jgi:hypothetical protein
MIDRTYYAMKTRLGGEKLTGHEFLKLRNGKKWSPCPGCLGHAEIIGGRRAGILFNRYVNGDNALYIMYWRSHPVEWGLLQDQYKLA